MSANSLLKKGSECFEHLSINGNTSEINSPPFVLSRVEGLRERFSTTC